MRRRTERDERGAVAVLVAVSLVVLGMSCAMAVDIGNLAQLHRHAQYTADNAAISGADLLEQGSDSLTQIVSATEGYIDENWNNLPSSAWATCPSAPAGFSAPTGSSEDCVTFNGASNTSATAISVEFPPQSVPFSVARLGGFTSGTVSASATAVIVPGVSPCALCVLGTSGVMLDDTGSGTFAVNDGPGSGNAGIIVDSNGQPAAAIGGSGSITAPQTDLVGTYSVTNSGTFDPTPTSPVAPQGDPLGALAAPTPASTTIPSGSYSSSATNGTPLTPNTYGSITLRGNGSVTIPPGNYSNLSVGGGATLTLESGMYFISGSFSVGGTGSTDVAPNVNESGGVLLYFTCSSGNQITPCTSASPAGGSLSLTGTGQMALAPMTTGPYANLTVFYDRNNNQPMTLYGTANLTFSGTVYAKSSNLTLKGNSGTTLLSSLVIVNSAQISGNSPVTVTYDASQNAAPPGAPYLCSTSANNC